MKENGIKILPHDELAKLDSYESVFNTECATAIKWVYKLQQWQGKAIEQRIPNIKASVWQAYGQRGYKKKRTLHVLAALSWMTQVTMTALYHGSNIQHFWRGVNNNVIETIVYSGLLTPTQFNYLVVQMQDKIINTGNLPVDVSKNLNKANQYLKEDFLMPNVLDLTDFKTDYYRSISLTLKEFKARHSLTSDTMAYVLNISKKRYEAFEDKDNPVSIPLHVAMRLKLGFQIKDTVTFTDHMSVYPQFANARHIQQLREQIIIDLLSPVEHKPQLAKKSFTKHVMEFHKV